MSYNLITESSDELPPVTNYDWQWGFHAKALIKELWERKSINLGNLSPLKIDSSSQTESPPYNPLKLTAAK